MWELVEMLYRFQEFIYNTDSSIMTVRVTNTTTGHSVNDGFLITQTGNATDIMNKENSSLSLGTNNNTEITIVAAGNVGVNTTSPSSTIQLDVNGSGSATGIRATADQQAGLSIQYLLHLQQIDRPLQFMMVWLLQQQ